jgi:hypothetical protein
MSMLSDWNWPMGVGALALLALGAWLFWKRGVKPAFPRKSRTLRLEDWPPRTMRPLTHAELAAFRLLCRALPECLLLPQISLARFLSVPQSRSYSHWFGSVGRRCVDFLVCSEHGDVLGVMQLQSSKAKTTSPGTQRKVTTLQMAQIPVWFINNDDLPNVQTLREMVMPELQAAEQHSVQHPESDWEATRLELRDSAAMRLGSDNDKSDRWDQAWPTEEARPSAFLDEMGMIEVPPLVIKGSGRSATGFTRG